ncbi:hypothetical protein [Paracoccus tegillarcae]|uniref:Uncharacterized protein n=1 Tax=Paracoccus tegillarcae TaxID=1529068 RepID=A0A2K9EUE5_9RHOB|nr:hypothetical protein [Paracoccus tegillarcae]AUH34486.1 hypothetical protein CUV01_14810 [Paracoccus tegillarcae]
MSRIAETPDDIREMADEVARLMVDRFGGARRGEFPSLTDMIRRRGGALPRRLRGQARQLAKADQMVAQPRAALQMDKRSASRAHAALLAHLRPLGSVSRWKNRTVNFAASVALGLLVLAAVVIWVMVRRGHL